MDLLINNAGLGDHGPFETADWARLDEMLQVNVVALTYLCHRLVPGLRYHRPGAILNVSSMASLLPYDRVRHSRARPLVAARNCAVPPMTTER